MTKTWKNTLLVAAACAFGLGVGVYTAQAQGNFTGGTVTPVTIEKQPGIVSFRFGKGARTKWHSHSEGQIILVEEGVARNQIKGQPIQELHAGETVFVGPNVIHWHGASPTQEGVQYNITRGDITWYGEVTDAEFNGPVGK